MLKRSQVTDKDQLTILLKEMDLLQKVFDKYDDWIFKTRGGCITAVLALISISFSKLQTDLRFLAVLLPLISWVLEGMIRWDHWYGYVQRYFTISKFLNGNEPPDLYVYDLKNYMGEKTTRPSGGRGVIRSSFGKLEPAIFYGFILLLCLLSMAVRI